MGRLAIPAYVCGMVNSNRAPTSPRRQWLTPTLLLLLSAIPVVFGVVRLFELCGVETGRPVFAHYRAAPVPLVLHIVGVTIYAVLGAFQFAPGLRRRRPAWHRVAGWVLVPSGLISALTGLWMVQHYPPMNFDGPILYTIRLAVGSAMVLFLSLGVLSILRRDVPAHEGWMIRAYALGLGAGTQALTHVPYYAFPHIQSELTRAISMGAGWAINLAVAEWILRRRAGVRGRLSESRVAARTAYGTHDG